MHDHKKAITVSFVGAALLLGLVMHLLFQFLAQNMAIFARIESNELLSNGLPVLIGAIAFAILQFNATTVNFMDGVVGELMKVVWPSRKDTGLMTVVVVVCLVISGVVVGLYDTIWAFLINKFIK